MLMPGVAGCTLDSALAAGHHHFEGGAVAGQPYWDINQAS